LANSFFSCIDPVESYVELSALLRRSFFDSGTHRVTLGGAWDLPTIQIKDMDVVHKADVGITILEANLDNDIEHPNDCGGNCACSTCKIMVLSGEENLSEQNKDERDTLDAYGWEPDEYRLSCQCVIEGEGVVVIEFPDPE
jgi:2Fe-2S ferredoxin